MDKVTIENTIRLLRRGKYEFTGDEAVVFYQCLQALVKELDKFKPAPVTPAPIVPKKKEKKKEEVSAD